MGPNSDFLNAADCPLFTKGECHLHSESATKDAKIKELEEEVLRLQEIIDDKDEEPEWEDEEGTEVDLGLDRLKYKLKNGNLKIQLQLEGFIKQLQKQNSICSQIF